MLSATIYSKNECPFCIKANNLLKMQSQDFNEIKLVRDLNRENFLAELTQRIGQTPTKVPQIFLGDQHIGGFTELAAHYGVDPDSVPDTPMS